jgi:mitogen-activated protein kinase organizer 1
VSLHIISPADLGQGPINAVTYSASPGNYILTGSSDKMIRLYKPFPGSGAPTSRPTPETGRLVASFAGHGYEVLALAVTPTNERIASGGGDRAVFLWDVGTARIIRRFSPFSTAVGTGAGRVNAVAFGGAPVAGGGSAPGMCGDSLILSGGVDAKVHVWDVRAQSNVSTTTTRPIQSLDGARDAISSVCLRGTDIIAGSIDGTVRTWDVRNAKVAIDSVGPRGVTGVCVAHDGRTMLVSGLDSRLRLVDRENGRVLKEFSHARWRNEELRVQGVLGGSGGRWAVAGDERSWTPSGDAKPEGGQDGDEKKGGDDDNDAAATEGDPATGRVWAWDTLTGAVAARVPVPWGPPGDAGSQTRQRRMVVGRDGKPRPRRNVVSCLAWRDDGEGGEFCAGGSSGAVVVFAQ